MAHALTYSLVAHSSAVKTQHKTKAVGTRRESCGQNGDTTKNRFVVDVQVVKKRVSVKAREGERRPAPPRML